MKAVVQFRAISATWREFPSRGWKVAPLLRCGALGGTRTPSLLIRSQMLYPLSYERRLNPG